MTRSGQGVQMGFFGGQSRCVYADELPRGPRGVVAAQTVDGTAAHVGQHQIALPVVQGFQRGQARLVDGTGFVSLLHNLSRCMVADKKNRASTGAVGHAHLYAHAGDGVQGVVKAQAKAGELSFLVRVDELQIKGVIQEFFRSRDPGV